MSDDGIQDRVIARIRDKFAERSAVGLVKYGVPLCKSPQSFEEHLVHKIEEGMDEIAYCMTLLMRLRGEIDGDVPDIPFLLGPKDDPDQLMTLMRARNTLNHKISALTIKIQTEA